MAILTNSNFSLGPSNWIHLTWFIALQMPVTMSMVDIFRDIFYDEKGTY